MGRKFNISISFIIEYMSIVSLLWLNGDRAVQSFFILHGLSSLLFGCNIRHFLMFGTNKHRVAEAVIFSFLIFFTPMVAIIGFSIIVAGLSGNNRLGRNDKILFAGFSSLMEKPYEINTQGLSLKGESDGSTHLSEKSLPSEKGNPSSQNTCVVPAHKSSHEDIIRDLRLMTYSMLEPPRSDLVYPVTDLENSLSTLSPSGLPHSFLKSLTPHSFEEALIAAGDGMHHKWYKTLEHVEMTLTNQNNAQILMLLHRIRLFLKQTNDNEHYLKKSIIKEIPKKLLSPIITELTFQKRQFEKIMQMMGSLDAKIRL